MLSHWRSGTLSTHDIDMEHVAVNVTAARSMWGILNNQGTWAVMFLDTFHDLSSSSHQQSLEFWARGTYTAATTPAAELAVNVSGGMPRLQVILNNIASQLGSVQLSAEWNVVMYYIYIQRHPDR